MSTVHELERAYRERLAQVPGSPALREVPWMLEELRVSQFAQSLGTRGPISAKRDPESARRGRRWSSQPRGGMTLTPMGAPHRSRRQG